MHKNKAIKEKYEENRGDIELILIGILIIFTFICIFSSLISYMMGTTITLWASILAMVIVIPLLIILGIAELKKEKIEIKLLFGKKSFLFKTILISIGVVIILITQILWTPFISKAHLEILCEREETEVFTEEVEVFLIEEIFQDEVSLSKNNSEWSSGGIFNKNGESSEVGNLHNERSIRAMILNKNNRYEEILINKVDYDKIEFEFIEEGLPELEITTITETRNTSRTPIRYSEDDLNKLEKAIAKIKNYNIIDDREIEVEEEVIGITKNALIKAKKEKIIYQ